MSPAAVAANSSGVPHHPGDAALGGLDWLHAAVFLNTSENVWLLDEAGKTLWANDRLALLLGEPGEMLQTRTFADFAIDDAASECLRACVTTGVEQHREMSFLRRGGIGTAGVRAIPLPGRDGSPSTVLVLITDVSQERRTEAALLQSVKELEGRIGLDDAWQPIHRGEPDDHRDRLLDLAAQIVTANKELEAFSYSVSHDLREPLRSIDGFSRILLERYGPLLDERGKDYLGRVRAAAQRMGLLIADMLTLARIARAEMAMVPVDLSDSARSICDELAETNRDREVQIEVEDGLSATGDARLLNVVLTNLLGNAWKFTSRRSDARISVKRCASDTDDVFLVSDNGVGFEMKYVQKLFRPFQRLHSDADFTGSGVGLATVQRIIARHGGRVWAEASVGEGARVFFSIPRIEATGTRRHS